MAHAVSPRHWAVEREFRLHLPTSVQVCVRDQRNTAAELVQAPPRRHRGSTSWSTVPGAGRIRFRHAFHPWRKLFFYQAVYPRSPSTDFKGFFLSGEFRLSKDGYKSDIAWCDRAILVALAGGAEAQLITGVMPMSA